GPDRPGPSTNLGCTGWLEWSVCCVATLAPPAAGRDENIGLRELATPAFGPDPLPGAVLPPARGREGDRALLAALAAGGLAVWVERRVLRREELREKWERLRPNLLEPDAPASGPA